MIKIKSVIFLIVSLLTIPAVFAQDKKDVVTEKATFGMGCFWCSEAIFQRLKGVTKVESGYSGGTVKNPTYEDVCTGTTGHAEVVQVTFKPEIISYKDLLEIFWKMHDPTTLNRQGADEGTQYRSAIFYHNAAQKQLAETYKAELNKQKVYPHPIVTEITRFSNFFVAENYHQNYFNLNGSKPYCRMVIQPKVDKLEKVFQQKLKQ
ncbi:peptide-methionine (S)-S-oxide reductase MsrA [Mucilaginibacter sp. PAMB04274]|uniref:peptide-methionine (S)-S-oxide reductase MsrA n=1 Tax=Mucilaginibacter sp. PAMB04274 TaxID=3138568 RepID=UPI0031F639E6